MKVSRSGGLIFSLLILLFQSLPAQAGTDVTSSVQVNRGRPYYDYAKLQTYSDISLTNISDRLFSSPVKLVIDSITTAGITVDNPDGYTGDGKPYLDFSAYLADTVLNAGETSSLRVLRFNNPHRLRFNFTTQVLAEIKESPPANQSPEITSQPVTEGRDHQSYQYQVVADDPDGDLLTFSLSRSPSGMAIESATGLITWTPSGSQVGINPVSVIASDVKGGTDTQLFEINVVDLTPPMVTVSAPREVLPGTAVTVTAKVSDNAAVESVTFKVNGADPLEVTIPPYQRMISVPQVASIGEAIRVQATAIDPSQNRSTAETVMTIVSTPDMEDPTVVLNLPPQAALGTSMYLTASPNDNVGVAAVSFFAGDILIQEDTESPYEATYLIPSDTPTGSLLAFSAQAVDYSGNMGETNGTTVVVQSPDIIPPSATLSAPGEIVAGGTLLISATVTDDTGVASVAFSVDNVPVFTDTQTPYEAGFPLPAGTVPGTLLRLEVRAIDFSGLEATDSGETLVIAAPTPGRGVIACEVYDDTTGLPVEGAIAEIISLDGKPAELPRPSVVSDARGRFRMASTTGVAGIRISKPGFTESNRMVQVVNGKRTDPFDARLTPLDGKETVVSSVIGGTVSNLAGDLKLIIPPGSLSENQTIHLTHVSPQGLAGMSPLGWSPVVVSDIFPRNLSFLLPSLLSVTAPAGFPSGAAALVARWDEGLGAWMTVGDSSTSFDGKTLTTTLHQGGQYAFLLADQAPDSPPTAVVGESVPGLLARPPPGDVTALIIPSPRILFAQPGVYSDVGVLATSPGSMPSGTPFHLDLSETFNFLNGTHLYPNPAIHDFILYAFPAGGGSLNLQSDFTVTPSRTFAPFALHMGVIDLAVRMPIEPGAPSGTIIGPDGGTATASTGERLVIPPGAAAEDLPVVLSPLAQDQFPFPIPAGLTFLAALNLDLHGGGLNLPAALSIPAPSGISPDTQVLVVQLVEIQGVSYLNLVGLGSIEGSDLVVMTNPRGDGSLLFPGIRGEGRYTFLQTDLPLGFVTGTITGNDGLPLAGIPVTIDTLSIIALTDTEGQYVLAAPVGNVRVTAVDQVTGNIATLVETVEAPGAVSPLSLSTVPTQPSVVSVSPADGQTGVPVTSSIAIQFSRKMDATTINAPSFQIREGATAVAGRVTLLPDGTNAVFWPAVLLNSETIYTILLSANIRDSFGQTLFGNQPDGSFVSVFTTLDTTPPPIPQSGQITMTMPDGDGIVTIKSTQGAAEPGTAVTIINGSTGVSTTVIAADNGSFEMRIIAATYDSITLILRDPSGNETRISPGVFDQGDGSAVVGESGGVLSTPDGSTFTFAQGSFNGPANVQVQRITEEESPVPTPVDFNMAFAAGFTLDTGGKELLQPLKFSIPVDQAYPEGSKFLVCRVDEVNGEKYLIALDTADYGNGAIRVNSPPWPGILNILPTTILTFFLQQSVSFVQGQLLSAPPIGTLTIEVPEKMEDGHNAFIRVQATPILPGVEVQSVKLGEIVLGVEDFPVPLASTSESHIEMEVPVNPILYTAVTSWVKYAALGQTRQTWRATAVFKRGDEKYNAKVDVSTQIFPRFSIEPYVDPKRISATDHVYMLSPEEAKPVAKAWVRLNNGLGPAYPSVAQTNYLGNFVLAAAPGNAYLQIFDPVTGNGKEFPIIVPSTLFDFVDMGPIMVPERFGDVDPPTIDVQITGPMEPYQLFHIGISVTDDESIAWVNAFVQDKKFIAAPNAQTFSQTFSYMPQWPGEFPIDVTAADSSGNQTSRRVIAKVSFPSSGAVFIGATGLISISSGSINVAPDIKIDIALPTPVAKGTDLSDMENLEVYFQDPATGHRFPAVGGVTCPDNLRIKPLDPLPFNKDLELVVGDEHIPFHIRGLSNGVTGLSNGGLLSGFKEIRGIATYRDYAYVADFRDEAKGVKVVSLVDPVNPVLVGGFASREARAVATGDGFLAVAGGGQDTLPVIRFYSLADPVNPAWIRSFLLYRLEDVAIPVNVRLKGSRAYISTIGAGVQVLDLEKGELTGFRLPDPNVPEGEGDVALDVALDLDYLAVTGGTTPHLYILSATGASLNAIPQENELPYFNLSLPIQRFDAESNFLIHKDLNGDGKLDYQNLNLLVVSHGTGLSLLDLSSPNKPKVLSTLINGPTDNPILDIALIDGYAFSGSRLISVYDPFRPEPSDPLKITKDGQEFPLTSGGDVALEFKSLVAKFKAILFASASGTMGQAVLPPMSSKFFTALSSNLTRDTLQVMLLEIPDRGRGWDVIRPGPYEPRLNPDNEAYLDIGDPVNPFTGEFMTTETDLAIPGRGIDFTFTRTYRSQIEYSGPMGYGWDHNYNDRLTVDPGTGDVIRYDGTGRGDPFFYNTATKSYTSPRGMFSILTRHEEFGQVHFELIHNDGMRHFYHPSQGEPGVRFLLSRIEDRYGNTLRFYYNASNQLVKIQDALGRNIRLTYDSQGRLIALQDFTDRVIRYQYDFDDNLIAVTGPPVDEFPQGKTTTYDYTCGFRETDALGNPAPARRLNHNLRSITDPKGQTYLKNTYSPTLNPSDLAFDRVQTQTLGNPQLGTGGEYQFSYEGANGLTTVARTTNRSGHQTRRHYSAIGHLVKLEEDVTIDGVAKTLITETQYSEEGLIRNMTSPRGIKTEYTYNETAPDLLRQGDIKQVTTYPAGGGVARQYSYTPGPWGIPAHVKDPEGHVTSYGVDEKGSILSINSPLTKLSDGTHQQIVKRFNYGAFGVVESITAGDGVVTRYVYYDGIDPNGDGSSEETEEAREEGTFLQGPGYLKAVIVDSSVGGGLVPRTVSGPPLNLRTDYAYDVMGNILTVTDPRGNTITNVYNFLNQIVTITDYRGTRQFQHDGNDNVAVVQDLGERHVTNLYDSLDRLVSRTEEAPGISPRATLFGYDPSENLNRARSPLGYETLTRFDERGLPVEIRTGGGPLPVEGLLNRAAYDEEGNLVRSENAEGESVITAYNGFNEVETVTDPNGTRMVSVTDPRGLIVEQKIFAANGELLSEVKTERDEMGRIRTTHRTILIDGQSSGVETTRYHYDPANRVILTTEAGGRETRVAYDGLGRIVLLLDPVGNQTESAYTGLDRVKETRTEVVPDGTSVTTTIEYEYDPYGRLVASRHAPRTPDERVQRFIYDSRDNLLSTEDVGGITLTYDYDSLNRVTAVTRGRETLHHDYDEEDRVVRIEDALQNGMDYIYDGRDRLVERILADGSRERYTYFLDNQIETFADRAGNVFTYQHDIGNRLSHITANSIPGFEGTTGRSFTYDGLGRMLTATSTGVSSSREVTFQYDSSGVVLRQTQGVYEVTGTYNISGERIQVAYPSGPILEEERNTLGLLASVTSGGKLLVEYNYSGPALRSAARFGNGTQVARRFNLAREEHQRKYLSPGGVLQTGFDLLRDPAGRLTGAAYDQEGGSGNAYEYTPEGWLSTAKFGLPRPLDEDTASQTAERLITYQYDSRGNWTTRLDNGTAEAFASNLLNQYQTAGFLSLQYDGNGNLRTDGRRTFIYDTFGQLLRVTDTATGTVLARYEYDALGRRIREIKASGVEEYIYDGIHVIAVLDGNANSKQEYVYADMVDRPVLIRTGGKDYYYQYDLGGNIVAVTDDSGNVVEQYTYDAFGLPTILDPGGNTRAVSTVGNRLTFAGRPWDADTGLIYMRARDYDPNLGRFLETDPLGPVDGLNLYAYAGNDPIQFIDPTGLFREASADNMRIGHLTGSDFWTIANAPMIANLAADLVMSAPALVSGAVKLTKGAVKGLSKGFSGAAKLAEGAVKKLAKGLSAGRAERIATARNALIKGLEDALSEQTKLGAYRQAYSFAGATGIAKIRGEGFAYESLKKGEIGISGHGRIALLPGGRTKYFTVPENTYIVQYVRQGEMMGDDLGKAIELGRGRDGGYWVMFRPGNRIADVELTFPSGLGIEGNPAIVPPGRKMFLSEMISPGMGKCHVAACLYDPRSPHAGIVRGLKETWILPEYDPQLNPDILLSTPGL